jgi:hypothetical protein
MGDMKHFPENWFKPVCGFNPWRNQLAAGEATAACNWGGRQRRLDSKTQMSASEKVTETFTQTTEGQKKKSISPNRSPSIGIHVAYKFEWKL